MRGVDQAPARIDRRVVEQPLHRPHAAPGQAVIHLLLLFGDVDMHRRGGVHRVQPGHGAGQALRRHRAQRMRRQPEPRAVLGAGRGKVAKQRQHGIRPVQEAPLVRLRRLAAEAGGLVQHRQQRHADAGPARRAQQPQRHLGGRGVRLARRVMMDVMKFADAGIAGAQHLYIELGGDGLQRVRRKPQREAVHQRAPAPERVPAGRVFVRRDAAVLGQSGKAALERVRVEVGHARQHRAGRVLVSRGGGSVGRDLGQPALRIPAQADVALPAFGQEGRWREEVTGAHALAPAPVSVG
ncbi:hypothetical protein D3C87_1085280 [compost metagenome]